MLFGSNLGASEFIIPLKFNGLCFKTCKDDFVFELLETEHRHRPLKNILCMSYEMKVPQIYTLNEMSI